MTSTQVLDLKGKKVGELQLEDSVFASELKVGPMHQAVIRQLANARSGSANTKTRAEVRGGGRKPWRQKGTGRARAGSIRSPLWKGGGVVFGPKPRDYSISMPQKMRHVALRSALSASREKFIVVKTFDSFGEAKTKQFAQLLKDLNIECGKKVLVVLNDPKADSDAKVLRAARNIDKLKVISAAQVNVKDLLHFDVILTSEVAIESINKNLKKEVSKNPYVKEEKAEKKKPSKKAAKKPVKKAKEAKSKGTKEAKAKVKSPKPAKEETPKAEKAPKKDSDKEKKAAAKADNAKSADKPKKKDKE
jgi:large subunit ribosomal protein L4